MNRQMDEAQKLAAAMQVIDDCTAILAEHLPPDGPDAKATITRLLEILDGPRVRELKR